MKCGGSTAKAERVSLGRSVEIVSERPIALMPTLIRWWEALRAPEVAKWQQKYRVDWDATDGRNGGAQRTVWEVILVEVERVNWKGKSRRSRSCGFGPRPGEGIRASQPSCSLVLGSALQLPKEDLASAVRVHRAPEACTVGRMCGRGLGAKEKARRKKCKIRFSLLKKESSLPKELHESRCQEVATSGCGTSKDLGSPCSGDGSH